MNNQQIGELINQFGDRVIAGDPEGEILQTKGIDIWIPATLYTLLNRPDWEYRVSLGRCEGKPVFVGDVLYSTCCEPPTKIVAEKSDQFNIYGSGCCFAQTLLTWNPPKPKEITVTIPLDLAEHFIRYADNSYLSSTSQQVAQALKKEMEKLNLTKGETE